MVTGNHTKNLTLFTKFSVPLLANGTTAHMIAEITDELAGIATLMQCV